MHIGYNLSWDQFIEFLPLIMPIVILQFILMVVALIDLMRSQRGFESKLLWGGIILVVTIVGPIIYFIIGRKSYT
ncbi:PLD nuclease N-terminal domain-containing protein [Bacillus horti]|uniref:Cardiolipin synthase N-terminal domain-containing protein n=1 Tax=Caldalkalibacillus horti TaxID=77523 RepID=A0ABT9VXB5_9BACI|nr:PLD nuclease N-terminal domain-containing protein [Bacillus horti]MDQ0165614.1 hypothetical protein [Bacillus horti]